VGKAKPRLGDSILKLLVTRRLSYVGTVLPLLLCSTQEPATSEHLVEAYSHPTLARVARLLAHEGFEERDELATVLVSASRFNEALSDDAKRAELDAVGPHPKRGDALLFDEMRDLTSDLEGALRKIFTGSLLHERVDQYLIL